jgi:hypothetical protein
VEVDANTQKSTTRTVVLQKTEWERVCSISRENGQLSLYAISPAPHTGTAC